MKIAPYVFFRVSTPPPPISQTLFPSDMMAYFKVAFRYARTANGRVFFECTQCENCGCPSFSPAVGINQEIPEEIVKHLEMHANLYHVPHQVAK